MCHGRNHLPDHEFGHTPPASGQVLRRDGVGAEEGGHDGHRVHRCEPRGSPGVASSHSRGQARNRFLFLSLLSRGRSRSRSRCRAHGKKLRLRTLRARGRRFLRCRRRGRQSPHRAFRPRAIRTRRGGTAAKTRWVWQSTKPGSHHRARRRRRWTQFGVGVTARSTLVARPHRHARRPCAPRTRRR